MANRHDIGELSVGAGIQLQRVWWVVSILRSRQPEFAHEYRTNARETLARELSLLRAEPGGLVPSGRNVTDEQVDRGLHAKLASLARDYAATVEAGGHLQDLLQRTADTPPSRPAIPALRESFSGEVVEDVRRGRVYSAEDLHREALGLSAIIDDMQEQQWGQGSMETGSDEEVEAFLVDELRGTLELLNGLARDAGQERDALV